MPRKPKQPLSVDAITHEEATRRNIPTAEAQALVDEDTQSPIQVAYQRRNKDLDPQLVWRGKDQQDWSDLVVHAPPLYIQEKIHPKVLIDDLRRRSEAGADEQDGAMGDLFADFNGLPSEEARTEFYQHEGKWQNRMILGDSLQVMASLAEREGLRGKVQCVFLDPPYGINFSSNWQWSTTSRQVREEVEHITREPEQVKAFRDTWRDGVHTYLTYLRDRLTAARDLLCESGSIFVQIGDENVHRVRSLLEEVFGRENFLSEIIFRTNSPMGEDFLPKTTDYLLWFARDKSQTKYRQLFLEKGIGDGSLYNYLQYEDGIRRPLIREEKQDPHKIPKNARPFYYNQLSSSGYTKSCFYGFPLFGGWVGQLKNSWKTNKSGMLRLISADRLIRPGKLPYMVGFHDDYPVKVLSGNWDDTRSEMGKTYVVQTQGLVVQRCLLMATDPGDLVLDPTCGSGTTAAVAEQWGRRWITIDTSRVALALARARIMGARYPYYLLSDSPEGQQKEAELTRSAPSTQPTRGDVRHGFVYERVPHITLKSIANNTEIDVIWERMQPAVEAARTELNASLAGHTTPFAVTTGGRAGQKIDFTAPEGQMVTMPSGEEAPANGFMEWEIPREAPEDWPQATHKALEAFWQARIARQKEIDASIAAKAEHEYLYDKPYVDKSRVRVAGPFTVESLSPHRVLGVDENDELIDPAGVAEGKGEYGEGRDFAQIILENLKTAGVQQAHRDDRISFTALTPWPGDYVCADGRYEEGEAEKRAAIFIGPEFGTVSRPDLVAAAREAADAGFDVLIACAFNFDAHAGEFDKLGRVPVLKARMNADLHMAEDLKNTGKGNLFVIFGEPDIDILDAAEHDGEPGQVQVQVNGVDVFKPQTGEVVSDGPDGIACWFIDTDYNEESFFVRHAYFLGANDPYKALKTTLKAEINEEAWESLHSNVSRPFDKPESGRIAVKIINHLGDEVMKVFRVDD